MTTLFLHILGAFLPLLVLNRLFDLKIPLEHLAILSLAGIFPDTLDKTLTGTRYPFHSLLVSGLVLVLLNIIVNISFKRNKEKWIKYKWVGIIITFPFNITHCQIIIGINGSPVKNAVIGIVGYS